LASGETPEIRVALPYHLRNLAQVGAEVQLEVAAPVHIRAILDALELRYPMLRGTIRDYATGERRPFLRFFACQEDLSLEPLDAPLPEAVVEGREPFLIIGAVAGGMRKQGAREQGAERTEEPGTSPRGAGLAGGSVVNYS
jgi:sulfur-carrier protein